MKKITLLCMITLVIYACRTSNKNIEEIKRIEIDVRSATENVDLTGLIQSVKHVRLETSDSCLLREVKKIVITDQDLIIFDDLVYIFDLEGNFKLKVGRKGKGPGEFVGVNDFVVDEHSGNIEMYDFMQDKVCIFSKTGKYLHEIKFPFGRINRFEKKKSGDYVAWKCLGNLDDENAFLGYKIYAGNFQEGFTEYKPCYQFDGNLRMNQSFSKNERSVFFWEMLNDTIFEINSDNEFSKLFYIDFGKNKTPESIQRIPLNDRVFTIKDNCTIATAVNNFFYSPEIMYFNFAYNRKLYNVFTHDGITYVGNNIIYKNVQYSTFVYFNGNNILATVEYPDKISNSLRKSFDKEFIISDNPMIAIFKLKKSLVSKRIF